MNKFVSLASALHKDEDGASLVEYAVLLGITLACGLGVIYGVGSWAKIRITNLTTAATTP